MLGQSSSSRFSGPNGNAEGAENAEKTGNFISPRISPRSLRPLRFNLAFAPSHLQEIRFSLKFDNRLLSFPLDAIVNLLY